jgi:hypothetical protein
VCMQSSFRHSLHPCRAKETPGYQEIRRTLAELERQRTVLKEKIRVVQEQLAKLPKKKG